MWLALLYLIHIRSLQPALLHGDDQNLLATYEAHGHDDTLLLVQSPIFQPSEESLLLSLEFRRPDIFSAQLSKLNPESINRVLLQLLWKAIRQSHIAALEHIVRLVPESLVSVLEGAMTSSRLRVALWVYSRLLEADPDYTLDLEGSILTPYLFAFTHLDPLQLKDWLRDRVIEEDDKLREELLILCLERQLPPSLLAHLMEAYHPVRINHSFRLSMLIALIEAKGSPAGLLPLVIGSRSDPSRLWLVYVEEAEIGWRLLQHSRLDLVFGLIRDEFAEDSNERNYQRMKRALQDAIAKWPDMPSLTCPMVRWLGQWLCTGVHVRALPLLGYLPLADPIGHAAFDVAMDLFWKSGAFIDHLQNCAESV